jgi:hypothetical protein
MQFTPHHLKESLAPYIDIIFHYSGLMPDHSIERVVPKGHVLIIFELDDMVRHTYDPKTLKPNGTFTKAWVVGMHKNFLSISAHPDSEMFVIQFKAAGSYPFFHQPIHTWNEKIVAAESVFGADILQLRQEMMGVASPQEKFELADTWLQGRLDPAKVPSTDLLKMLASLQQGAATDFPEIIASYPNTQKHLIDQFKKYIGLTPKSYQRVLRFNEILEQIQQQSQISWAQVAYQCGYTDQSHFIKEFKYFSGFNPKDFIGQDFHQQETNFFPLDREE